MGKENPWTEGEWTVERYGDGDSLVVHSDKDTRVCFLATPTTPATWVTIKANARLIANAPAMAEELDNQVRNCLGCGGDGVFLTAEPPSERMVQKPCEHCANARALLNTIREKGNG